ncbi:MAG: hypothetical protein ACLR6J_00440 [Parabacteroides merdae]
MNRIPWCVVLTRAISDPGTDAEEKEREEVLQSEEGRSLNFSD